MFDLLCFPQNIDVTQSSVCIMNLEKQSLSPITLVLIRHQHQRWYRFATFKLQVMPLLNNYFLPVQMKFLQKALKGATCQSVTLTHAGAAIHI